MDFESPEEKNQRLAKQNQQYQGRKANGWRHPKDRRGPGHRMIAQLKKGPFPRVDLINALKADLNRPSLGLSPFVTDEILDETKYAIQDYLGIPRT